MNCDYCPAPAQFRATSRGPALSATRHACRTHVDTARTDCAVVCPPTIVELGRPVKP